MEKLEVIQIIKALASGIDPQTGKEIPFDSPYRHIKTIRALRVAVKELEGGSVEYAIDTPIEKTPPVTQPPQAKPLVSTTNGKAVFPNAGNAWTEKEEQELLEAFHTGMPLGDLAKKHQRSKGAIRSRLLRNGIVI